MSAEMNKILIKNKDFEQISKATKEENLRKLMLFLSYDITNSTELKVKYPKEWANIINILVKDVSFDMLSIWKFNGDEVIYGTEINGISILCEIIEEAYKSLFIIQNEMKKNISEITIKGTLWIALTEDNLSKYEDNFEFPCNGVIDYVGKHIDEGFRLSKYSSMAKMAIDPKIVYLLLNANVKFDKICQEEKALEDVKKYNLGHKLCGILKNIRLIGYSHLKGVWGSFPYPIYWYYDQNPQGDIFYGEYLNSDHLWGKKLCSLINDEYDSACSCLHKLEQVFKQVGVIKEIKRVQENIKLFGEYSKSQVDKANLYFMVACVNPVTFNVMIAKRSKDRKHLKGVWDFGNVKYQNVDMRKTIEKEYKNTFGIDIKLLTDSGRGNNLRPFGYCTIYRNCKAHNSILLYATINNPKRLNDEELIELINNNKNDKYQEVRFVNGNEDLKDFKSLDLNEIRIDSEKAEKNANGIYDDYNSIMYFENSVKGAIVEAKKVLLRRRVYHYRKKLKR